MTKLSEKRIRIDVVFWSTDEREKRFLEHNERVKWQRPFEVLQSYGHQNGCLFPEVIGCLMVGGEAFLQLLIQFLLPVIEPSVKCDVKAFAEFLRFLFICRNRCVVARKEAGESANKHALVLEAVQWLVAVFPIQTGKD